MSVGTPAMPLSHSELEEFFDLALDLMVIAGFDGSFRRVNAAYERTLDHPVRELLSRPFLDTVHPEDVPWVREVFGKLAVGVRDDGIGGARRDGGGLLGLADRLAALDGQLQIESPSDGGTLISAAIPLTRTSPRGSAP